MSRALGAEAAQSTVHTSISWVCKDELQRVPSSRGEPDLSLRTLKGCDLRQISQPMCALVSSSVRWEGECHPLHSFRGAAVTKYEVGGFKQQPWRLEVQNAASAPARPPPASCGCRPGHCLGCRLTSSLCLHMAFVPPCLCPNSPLLRGSRPKPA